MSQATQTFPKSIIPSSDGGVPIEVTLLAQLLPGQGNGVIRSINKQQAQHHNFVDALDEPSTRIGEIHLKQGDPSSLYTFSVGQRGHPFHRHAGSRMFTAMTGSGGAQLRFSTASLEQIEADPGAFIRSIHVVIVPADCWVAVRFGPQTWHQFLPLSPNSGHPALCAISSHPNEVEGNLPASLMEQVLNNQADIPSLTEVLPPFAHESLEKYLNSGCELNTTALSLNVSPHSLAQKVCGLTRRTAGAALNLLPSPFSSGFTHSKPVRRRVAQVSQTPAQSLLSEVFQSDHYTQDWFEVRLSAQELGVCTVQQMLERLLEGFIENPPKGVSRLMGFRNLLVKRMGLRTSPLGCPVSSLLSEQSCDRFLNRFPVWSYQVQESCAEVLLGADDLHLRFRSVVGVREENDGSVVCWLGTRVKTINTFGLLYMHAIGRVHHHYIAPTMLNDAVDYAVVKPI